ncbi:MAG: hypothetical protein R6W81_10790 [Bacteroidales bacterium]
MQIIIFNIPENIFTAKIQNHISPTVSEKTIILGKLRAGLIYYTEPQGIIAQNHSENKITFNISNILIPVKKTNICSILFAGNTQYVAGEMFERI